MPATYEPISTTTLGSAVTSFTISSIPSSYTDLRLILSNVTSNAQDTIRLRVNGNTAQTYSNIGLCGDGTTITTQTNQNTTSIRLVFSGSITTANPALITVDFLSYAQSKFKNMIICSNSDKAGTNPAASEYFIGLWQVNDAINSITIFFSGNQIQAGTTATLYGILRA